MRTSHQSTSPSKKTALFEVGASEVEEGRSYLQSESRAVAWRHTDRWWVGGREEIKSSKRGRGEKKKKKEVVRMWRITEKRCSEDSAASPHQPLKWQAAAVTGKTGLHLSTSTGKTGGDIFAALHFLPVLTLTCLHTLHLRSSAPPDLPS